MAESKMISYPFSDFSGGDAGRYRPLSESPTSFRGLNVWTYPAGIGPRPPFMDLGYTGLPQKKLRTFNVFRDSVGIIRSVWSFSDGEVWMSSVQAGSAATLKGTLAFPATDSCNFGDEIIFVSLTGNGGSLHSDGTVVNLPNLPTGYIIERFGQQAVVATTGTILRWSDLNDFTSWPVANTVPVGNPQFISKMFNQRNTLVVARLDGEVWGFNGVLGVNEVLRRLDTTQRHAFPGTGPGAVVNQGNIWWSGIGEMVRFTGAASILERRLDIPMKTGYDVLPNDTHMGAVHPLLDDDELLVVGTMDKASPSNLKQVWVHARHDGAWTRHLIPVTDFACTVSNGGTRQSRFLSEAVKVNSLCHDGFAYVCTTSDTSGNGGLTPQVFQFYARQEHPLETANTILASDLVLNTTADGKSGVPAVATFSGAEMWHPEGGQFTVRSVIVDYTYAPAFTPFSTFNRFDLSVEALQAPASVSVRRSTVQAFTPPASGDSADGNPLIRGQARFQMGDQGSGVGFRVRLDDWRGILVHRITVLVSSDPGQF